MKAVLRRSSMFLWLGIITASIIIVYLLFFHVLGLKYYIFVTNSVAFMLQLSGITHYTAGNIIAIHLRSEWTAVRISWECSAVVSITIFTGLVLGFPHVKAKNRIAGLVLGYSAIFLGNVLRIFLILYLSHSFPSFSYTFFHDFFGQPLSFLLMTIIWFVWFYQIFKEGENSK